MTSRKHLYHYLSLVLIVLAGLALLVFFSNNVAVSIAVLVGLAASYVAWGIIHHSSRKDLYLSVILEYIVIACFGLVIGLSLILQK